MQCIADCLIGSLVSTLQSIVSAETPYTRLCDTVCLLLRLAKAHVSFHPRFTHTSVAGPHAPNLASDAALTRLVPDTLGDSGRHSMQRIPRVWNNASGFC